MITSSFRRTPYVQLQCYAPTHVLFNQGVCQYGLENDFVYLCGLCASVVCARVSPRQKSLVVDMVRAASPDAVTLSVGDGANDVPMLQVSIDILERTA